MKTKISLDGKFLFILILIFLAQVSYSQAPTGLSVKDTNGQNNIFFEDFNGPEIDRNVWRVATWVEHGGQTGEDRCFIDDGFLKMVFINDPVSGFLSSAIESKGEFLYGKWETKIKISNIHGVLNSFYTIDWDDMNNPESDGDGSKQEIDIEFLTYTAGFNSGKVHFAVHEYLKKSFDTSPDLDIDFDPSSDFHVWGFEITPDYIEWFVDDAILYRYEYEDNPISITEPYQIKLNTWSETGGWVQGPPQSGVECTYLIDWIKFTPKQY